MEANSFDVIVLGSGAAGLRAAISAREAGRSVCVLSKGRPGKSTCTGWSAGVMAGSTNVSEKHAHLERTLTAGRGLSECNLARILVDEAPQCLDELRRWGIHADLLDGYLYAKSQPPALGMEIVRCLIRRNEALGTAFWGGLIVTDLMTSERAVGVNAYAKSSGKWVTLLANALVLATGGASALFLRHDNPKTILGDGWGLALEAGANLRNLEFVQFYPLCLAEEKAAPLVIPPRLADRGWLYNDDHEDILEKYDIKERPAAERARDKLSQALFKEIDRHGKRIWLDLRHISSTDWGVDPFAAGLQPLLIERHGAANRPLRVAPAAHHCMGGVKIDATGATSVRGVFAAGEVTGGLHGANRMGGNALSETLVFGARAGSSAAARAEGLSGTDSQALVKALKDRIPRWSRGRADTAELKDRLRTIMWEDGGIVREAKRLSRALSTISEIRQEAASPGHSLNGKAMLRRIDLESAARTAELILEAALIRCESRGSHFREDFPDQDDAHWQGHLQVCLSPNGSKIWRIDPISPTFEPFENGPGISSTVPK